MSIIIAKVSGTTCNPVTVAFVTNLDKELLHTVANSWAVDNFGQWASVQYCETYQVSSISTTDMDIQRIVNLDDYADLVAVDDQEAMKEMFKN
jgi:hypothetical protein